MSISAAASAGTAPVRAGEAPYQDTWETLKEFMPPVDVSDVEDAEPVSEVGEVRILRRVGDIKG